MSNTAVLTTTPVYDVVSTNPVTGATARFSFSTSVAAFRCQDRLRAAGQDAWVDFDDDGYFDEGPSCSICDALGHGYPGGGPCPLEDRGRCECGGQQAPDGSGCLCGGS